MQKVIRFPHHPVPSNNKVPQNVAQFQGWSARPPADMKLKIWGALPTASLWRGAVYDTNQRLFCLLNTSDYTMLYTVVAASANGQSFM